MIEEALDSGVPFGWSSNLPPDGSRIGCIDADFDPFVLGVESVNRSQIVL